ncbi:MAG: methyl-accepting chemotaxis protein, partial [Clostridium sp.]|nr:methyl-accepting chemotaxis protein [Clostridium sp.]
MLKLFENLKVGKKLITCFSMITVVIIISGIMNYSKMKEIDGNVNTIYSNSLTKLSTIEHIRTNMADLTSGTLILVNPDRSGSVDETISDMSKLITEDNELSNKYASLVSDGEDKQLFNEYMYNLNNFNKEKDKFFAIVKAGNYDDIKGEFANLAEFRDKINNILDKEAVVNENTAKVKYNDSEAQYKYAVEVTSVWIAISILLSIIFQYILAQNIKSALLKIKKFAERISKFDFSTSINVVGKDEFAETGILLNEAQNNVVELLKSIDVSSKNMSSDSEELSATSEELMSKMEHINTSYKNIAKDVEGTSAASEEITASIEEITSEVNELSKKAADAKNVAGKAKHNAKSVQEKGKLAAVTAGNLYNEKSQAILKAIEDGKIVENIKHMAVSIEGIADQTNLLALNA